MLTTASCLGIFKFIRFLINYSHSEKVSQCRYSKTVRSNQRTQKASARSKIYFNKKKLIPVISWCSSRSVSKQENCHCGPSKVKNLNQKIQICKSRKRPSEYIEIC